jgi:hypothetical protein
MASLLLKRRQGHALRYLLLEMAAHQRVTAAMSGFQTIDGELVPFVTGELALRSGTAMLIGGLLVGTVLSEST